MQAVRGDKYNHGKTAGINLKGPIGGGSGHFFLSTPVKPDAGKTYFAGASYNLPVYDGTEMQVLGATEFVDGAKNDYILGAVITTKVGDDLALTGQAVASGINAFGFYGKANWKNWRQVSLTHLRICGLSGVTSLCRMATESHICRATPSYLRVYRPASI